MGISSVKINNIEITAERENSMRAIEYLVVVQNDQDGEHAFKFVVSDNGKIIILGQVMKLFEGVDVV